MKKQSTKRAVKGSSKSRGAAIRAQRRNKDDAERALSAYARADQAKDRSGSEQAIVQNALKVTFLGGLNDVGEKNMAVIEYGNDALILDCGINLGVDLPGVNYEINDTAYLASIKHKIKAYVITHGHLDHMGALKHTVPLYPAPIYGSPYTIGVIEQAFEGFAAVTGQEYTPHTITTQLDRQEELAIGMFTVEFIRVTHSLPDAAAICITTPVGRIVATGDFRLDPEPLDKRPTDTGRLKELGDKGVLLLLSESSYTEVEGRVPTESTLQKSFHDIIGNASGRIFVATFSSNMNRTQMIINAAVAAGRNVALDGRGMLAYSEIAVRQGILKVPKGTVVPIQQASTIAPDKLLVMCTGGQGEPNAALQRMSEGNHRHVNLNAGDTVVISSSPIPGNEIRYAAISNRLKKQGVQLFRHVSHAVDWCGPLHVSGHARRDELRDMIKLVRPKFLVPVHGGSVRRNYHADIAVESGVPRSNVILAENGSSFAIDEKKIKALGEVPHGSILIDQNGSPASTVAIKDRLLLAHDGIVTIVLTIDARTKQLTGSPDIIGRGFIEMKGADTLLNELRSELRRAVNQRYGRIEHDRFKAEIRDHVTHFLYDKTGRSPMVIPVVNKVGRSDQQRTQKNRVNPGEKQNVDQARFEKMRATLLQTK